MTADDAVREYRKFDVQVTFTPGASIEDAKAVSKAVGMLQERADAAIEALEADLAALEFHRDALLEELDDVKARGCIECKHVAICGLHVFWMTPGSHFKYTDGHAVRFCSEWTAGEDG